MSGGLETIDRQYLRTDLGVCPACYKPVAVTTIKRATGTAIRDCPHCGAEFQVKVGRVDVALIPKDGDQ